MWGATFQTADKKANNVGMVPAEIDLLVQRLAERMPERLQEEPDLRARAILFGFPAQISAVKKPVSDFLFFGFSPSGMPTSFLHDFLKITTYQMIPSNHWTSAAITIAP